MFKENLFSCSLLIPFNKMALYAFITITLFNAVLCIDLNNSTESEPNLLEVKLYYETLCPYSVSFLQEKLYKAMIEKEFLKYTDLKLIPYGNVKTKKDPETGQESLSCQHGLNECKLNALHACIVENNNIMEQLNLVNCLLDESTIEYCSDDLKINVKDALHCYSSRSIEDILKKYGQETEAVSIPYVPFITLDGSIDMQNEAKIRGTFADSFCEKYKEKYNVTLENCS